MATVRCNYARNMHRRRRRCPAATATHAGRYARLHLPLGFCSHNWLPGNSLVPAQRCEPSPLSQKQRSATCRSCPNSPPSGAESPSSRLRSEASASASPSSPPWACCPTSRANCSPASSRTRMR
ncbi:hypothetical protein ACFPRL_05080 [Pseudoclavibacter helvolus]